MILIVGLSLFLVFQTIPILVRNPPPVGFGIGSKHYLQKKPYCMRQSIRPWNAVFAIITDHAILLMVS
jgi:hypothetical protein